MSSEVYRAQRRTIKIGDIPLSVAMLPNGSYVFSQSQVTEVVDRPEISIRRLKRSRWLKSMPELHSEFDTLPIVGANRPIAPVSPEVAALYWQKCASVGNELARALVIALVKRSLYEMADEAFGVKSSAFERSSSLSDDLSDEGIARVETMCQSLSFQSCGSHTELEELNLRIRLAELELERERLRHGPKHNIFPAKDIDKMGAAPWKVVPWTQKTLGWADANATSRLLCSLGYGFKNGQWFQLKITGDVWVLPWPSFDALTFGSPEV